MLEPDYNRIRLLEPEHSFRTWMVDPEDVSFIHLQIFNEHLLCARYCSGHWRYNKIDS